MIREEDVLRQIWKDDDISFLLCNEEVRSNQEASGIFAWCSPPLKLRHADPQTILVIVDSVLLERESLCGFGEDVSFGWSAWEKAGKVDECILVFAVDQGYKGSTYTQTERTKLGKGRQGAIGGRIGLERSRRRIAGSSKVLKGLEIPGRNKSAPTDIVNEEAQRTDL